MIEVERERLHNLHSQKIIVVRQTKLEMNIKADIMQ